MPLLALLGASAVLGGWNCGADPATQMEIESGPASPVTTGAIFTIVVQFLDSQHNSAGPVGNGSVQVQLTSSPQGATLQGGPVPGPLSDTSKATFNLSVDLPGAYTLTFTFTGMQSVTFSFTAQAPGACALSPPATPSSNAQALAPGVVGASYAVQTLTASSGCGNNLVFSVSAGGLPPGITLSGGQSSATLSGTPTSAGTFSFTIQVTGSGGTSSQQYSIEVSPGSGNTCVLNAPTTWVAELSGGLNFTFSSTAVIEFAYDMGTNVSTTNFSAGTHDPSTDAGVSVDIALAFWGSPATGTASLLAETNSGPNSYVTIAENAPGSPFWQAFFKGDGGQMAFTISSVSGPALKFDGGVSNIWCVHGDIMADVPKNAVPGLDVVHFDAGI